MLAAALRRSVQSIRCYSHGSHETDEEFDARWVTYFNKPDIDAWELRKGNWNRHIYLSVWDKAGPHKDIYPYVIQELRPTLNELGISTPEELGLDKV
ncbi:cytochrome c oxidase subunit 5A [Cricetulus griseus]|uniref:Cytochrome c oxidase subunit 5A, mitochondrial n=1 Tax=Cricetulus griseus TaxID=10029 RepID=A0A061I421_CRIGR|nr:cytochrome c oxidase subunit 5A [Cricetulus griseus]